MAFSSFDMNIGAVIHRLESCLSTNDLAKSMAEQGEKEGTVIIADEQTKGKGTKGRTWHSPRGKGLYASVILRPKIKDVSLLPLVAGVAVGEAVSLTIGRDVGLKWPNDIIADGKKLGGILAESSFLGNVLNYAILGIGLNLRQERDDFPEEIREKAISLRLLTGRDINEAALLANLWRALDRWYQLFCLGNDEEIVQAFGRRLIFSPGKTITLTAGDKLITGRFAGINSRGRLIVESEGRRHSFCSAEISAVHAE